MVAEDVHAKFNATFGIDLGRGIVQRCTAIENGSGIHVGNAEIANSSATYNEFAGLIDLGGTVLANTASLNGSFGLIALNSVYGSNAFSNNGTGAVGGAPLVSQNNNICDGVVC